MNRRQPSLTFKALPANPVKSQTTAGFAAETFRALSARAQSQHTTDAAVAASAADDTALAELSQKVAPSPQKGRKVKDSTVASPTASDGGRGGDRGGARSPSAGASFTLPEDFPRDRITVVDSQHLAGVPVVMRSPEERAENPERLNLDNLGFTVCPILEHEYHLRLVNFQHNKIKEIEHLSNLKSLIFLDLYNNQISQLSGLESLSCLRVLMLGCNKITRISTALQFVPHLDVLDLHSNNIARIENLEALTKLRVLNLSDNQITVVENLESLRHLAELNLRKNKITSVAPSFEALQFLERLNLSENQIAKFADAAPIMKAFSIQELALTRNPICDVTHYRESWVDQLRLVRLFDGKRVTDEERRVAGINLRKENDKRRDLARVAAARAEREDDIERIHGEWSVAMAASQSGQQANVSIHCFAELEKVDGGECLHIYGNPQDAIERQWPGSGAIVAVHFQYAQIADIIPVLYRLRSRYPNVVKVSVHDTDIATFKHIAAFAVLRKVEHVVIGEDQPLCRNVSLWRKFALFRLSQLPLKSINGVDLTDNGARTAKTAFGSIGALLTEHEQVTLKQWEVPEEPTPSEPKRRTSGADASKRGPSSDHTAGVVGSRKVVRTALKDRPVPMVELQAFAADTISNLAAEAAALVDRRHQVDMLWDACAIGIITEALSDEVALPVALR